MDFLLHFFNAAAAAASSAESWAAFACGFVIGWLICFTGVGGGVLVVPVLSFFFGLPVSVAVGTASVYTTLTKLMAGFEHVRINNINYRLFAHITLLALPGLAAAAAAINIALQEAPQANAAIQTALRYAVIGVILLSLALILRNDKRPAATDAAAGGRGRGGAARAGRTVGGVGIGVCMGATGIGGGVLIAPVLLLQGETAKRVVGTSILIALTLSALTALLYAAGGQIALHVALPMALGSLAAVPLASRTLRRVSDAVIKKSLLGLILLAAALMLFNT